MFAGFESLDGLLGVIGDRGVDMDRVDLGIAEEFVVIGVALRNAEGVLDGLEFLRVALADREEIGVGVGLIDRNELGTEAEADDGDIDFLHEWGVEGRFI